MGPAGGGLPEQRADSSAVVPGKWDRSIHLFFLAEEGVPFKYQLALEISGVQIQVYEGADTNTLQALLQAAKSC